MAGVQGSALALAVSGAGGLGSLPCAMLAPDALRAELTQLKASGLPYNVNYFCHTPPAPDTAREAGWRTALKPYYDELGLDVTAIPAGPGRAPFTAEAADLLAEFAPPVVSFHFGLPEAALLQRVKATGARVTIENALTTGKIETIRFADGTTWSTDAPASGVVRIGTEGAEAGKTS